MLQKKPFIGTLVQIVYDHFAIYDVKQFFFFFLLDGVIDFYIVT